MILINQLDNGMGKQSVYSGRLSLTRLYNPGLNKQAGMEDRFYREITPFNNGGISSPEIDSDMRFLVVYLMFSGNPDQNGLVFPGQSREFMLHTYFLHIFNHCK
jgi:hypothetical protein